MTTPTSPSTYRAAVIGVGKAAERTWAKGGGHKIGYHHAQFLRELDRVEIATAADINRENLAAFQREFGLNSGFTDYREMLEKDCPDIVSICTYLGTHAEMVAACARAGVKIIICEKPFVASPAELLAVAEVLEETDAVLGLAHLRRFKPCYEEARNLVRAGAIGKPVFMAGGLGGWDLSEFGTHWIDLMRFIHDDRPVIHVMGQARVRDGFGYGHSMEDHGMAYFEFDDGCRGLIDGGRGFVPGVEGGEWDIRVVGSEGMLAITENEHIVLINGEGRRTVRTPNTVEAWIPLFQSLIDQYEGRGESPVDFARCRQTAEIQLGAYLSACKRDRIDLPFTGEDAAWDVWPVDVLKTAAPLNLEA